MSSTLYRAATGDISTQAGSRSRSRSRSRGAVEKRRNSNRSGGWERQRDQDASEREARSWEAEEYMRNLGRETFRHEGPRRSDFSSDPDRSARRLSTHRKEPAESSRNGAQVEFMNILSDILTKVAQQSSLQIQKENAKTNLERMKAQFEKALSYHKDFPSPAEAQTAKINRAQKDLDDIETKIAKNDSHLLGSLQAVAARCLPDMNGTDSKYLELKQSHEKLEQKVAALEPLNEQLQRRLTEFSAMKKQQDEFRVETMRLSQNIQSLQNNVNTLQEKVDSLLSTPHDLKSKLDSLSSRVDEFPRLRIEVSKTAQEVRENLKAMSEKSKMIDDIKISETERNGDIKKLKDFVERIIARDERFDAAIKKTNVNVSEIDDDLSRLQAKVTALESQVDAGAGREPAIPASDAVENLKIEIEALRKGQEATDVAYGEVIQGVKDQCEALQSSFNSMKEKFDSEIQRLSSMSSANEQKFSQRIENLQREAHGLQEFPSGMAAQRDSTPNSTGLSAAIFDLKLNDIRHDLGKQLKEVANGLESVEMGINHLDFRMNSLTTDQLARQMIGQLQTIYPNLSNVEASLASLSSITNTFKVQLQEMRTSIDSLKDTTNTQTGRLQEMGTSLDSVRDTTNVQEDQLRAMERNTGSLTEKVKRLGEGSTAADVSALNEKSDLLRYDIDLISQDVKGLSTRVQKFQDGFISREELKEKTDVFSKSLGTLKDKVDELDELRNAQAASQNGGRESRTPPAAVEPPSTKQKKRKRMQSTVTPNKTVSPNKAMNGHKKPRRKLLGGFQVESDEDDDFQPGMASSDDFSSQ